MKKYILALFLLVCLSFCFILISDDSTADTSTIIFDDDVTVIYRDVLSGEVLPGVYKNYTLDQSNYDVEYGNIIWAMRTNSSQDLFLDGEPYNEGTEITVSKESYRFTSSPFVYNVFFKDNDTLISTYKMYSNDLSGVIVAPSSLAEKSWYNSPYWVVDGGDGTFFVDMGEYVSYSSILSYSDNDYNVTFHSRYDLKHYSLKFDSSTCVDIVPDIDVTYKCEFEIPSVKASRPYYEASVWCISGADQVFNPGKVTATDEFLESFFESSSEIMLNPFWTKKNYTLNFISDASSGTIDNSIGFTVDSDINIPDNTLTKLGYIPDGWNTSSDGTGTELKSGQTNSSGEFIDSLFGTSSSVDVYPILVIDPKFNYIDAAVACAIFLIAFLGVFYLSYRRH